MSIVLEEEVERRFPMEPSNRFLSDKASRNKRRKITHLEHSWKIHKSTNTRIPQNFLRVIEKRPLTRVL